MASNSLTILTNRFFALVLKSPIQMGWLSIINSVTNISRLGTFKDFCEAECLFLKVTVGSLFIGNTDRDPDGIHDLLLLNYLLVLMGGPAFLVGFFFIRATYIQITLSIDGSTGNHDRTLII